jgi:hypothetical protein
MMVLLLQIPDTIKETAMSSILKQRTFVFKQLEQEFGRLLEALQELKNEERRLDEVERDLMAWLMKLGKAALRDLVKVSGDGDVGKTFEKDETVLKRMPEQHARTYRSVFGIIEIQRWVYAKRERQQHTSPLDEKLGLPADETSYVLEDWMGALATFVPYDTAAKWLSDVFGIGGNSTTVENRISKLGQDAEAFREQADDEFPDEDDEVLAVLADAKGVPIRTPWEQRIEQELGRKPYVRNGKNKEERSHKRRRRGDQVKSQQATVGVCFSVDPIVRTIPQVLHAKDQGVETPANFSHTNKRLWAEMSRVCDGDESRGAVRIFSQLAKEVSRRDPKSQRPLVCIMDGAASLWKLQREHLPKAIPIIDIFHVNEKLWAVAHCFERDGSKAAEDRVTRYLTMLLEGKVDSVRGVFQRFFNQRKWPKAKHEALKQAINYLKNNRHAMQYHEYLKQGYPIGSGAVEGACKHVIGDRLCRSGMRWEQPGAQDILHLRTIHLNGQWNEFIEHRIQTEQTTLYNQTTAA